MPFDQHSPRFVSQTAFDRLSRVAQWLPKIAFAGEFSAGKSTLINMLLGQDVLPTKATATALPPVWLRYGMKTAFWEDQNGTRHEVALDALHLVPSQSRLLYIHLPAPILSYAEIIDLPGISDPNRNDRPIHAMLRLAHMVVWCTPATQAWRQSELSTWQLMPPRLRRHSILAVTRADHLESERDQQRVLRRMRSETPGLFADQILVSAPALAEDGPAHALPLALEEQVSGLVLERGALLERYRAIEPPVLTQDTALESSETEADASWLAEVEDHDPPDTDEPPELLLLTDPLDFGPFDTASAVIGDAAFPEAEPEYTEDAEDILDDATLIARLSASFELNSSDFDDQPAAEDDALSAAAHEVPSLLSPVEEPEPQAAECPAGSAPQISRELIIWRDLVASTPLSAENAQLAALFDKFLEKLTSNDAGLATVTA